MIRSSVLIPLFIFACSVSLNAEELRQIGIGKVDITPTEPVILAGYGSRNKPSEGIDTKLWARAMAIGDAHPHLVIAVDNCGVPKEIADRIYQQINAKSKLDRAAFVICSTHTHNAPALPGYAPILWHERVDQSEIDAVQRYTKQLEDKILALGVNVLQNQVAARLSWGQGKVTFGGNRRVLVDGKWSNFGFQHDGPVDHSLPVLIARDADDNVIAVWTNYACHCTTVGAANRVGGDWAGFANQEIEKNFPKATSLTTIGCGADVGPQPSGSLELALQHGKSIAAEAKRLIETNDLLHPLKKELKSNSEQVGLPFANTHDRDYWQKQSELRGFDGVLGRQMLRRLENDGKLDPELGYAIASWQFGDELAIVFLPGEVCVDYAVRLKTEYDWQRIWINAWSNDVPCYIPSKRVLRQGGYEADFSMIYYDRPSRFADEVENRIVQAVGRLLGNQFDPSDEFDRPSIFSHPAPETITIERLKETSAKYSKEHLAIFNRIQQLAGRSQDGFEKLLHSDFEETRWYDFFGKSDRLRPYVRQQKSGHRLEWESAELDKSDDPAVVCFSGSLGWMSQPATDGFELSVDDRFAIKFDVTREIARFNSEDRQLELYYLPTWTSTEDSAGFFFLVLNSDSIVVGKPVRLCVKSIGNGSMRWFAIDKLSDSADTVTKLLEKLSE